jgi:hypothetical protein
MSTFDDLRAEYTKWHQNHADYEMRSMLFAKRFALQLGGYLQAPESYNDSKNNVHWYLQPMEATEDASGQWRFKEAEGLHDALSRCQDGLWATGLRLTLDRGPQTFPKSNFLFLIRLIIRDQECEMHVGFDDKVFSFDVSNPENLHPVFDHMVKTLRILFSMQPWDVPKKGPIGFVPPRTNT